MVVEVAAVGVAATPTAAPATAGTPAAATPSPVGGNRNAKTARSGGAAKFAARDFWGDQLPAADPVDLIPMSHDATAVIRSLGDPPLRGHEHLSGHYFAAVYGRASSVASALAAASGLLDMSPSDN